MTKPKVWNKRDPNLFSHSDYTGVDSGCVYNGETLVCLSCPLPECRFISRSYEMKYRALELLKQGKKQKDIARSLGVSRQTVYNWTTKRTRATEHPED